MEVLRFRKKIMSIIRIIPRLDIKGSNLVKGIHLEGLRVLGKPELFARHYYETGADELLYMDIVASLYGRNSLHEIIRKTAKEIFIPLTVGGGLRTIDDIRSVLRAGADKVSLNTAAIKRPEFIREAAQKFGSSTIVVSIEAKRFRDGRYEAYTDNGRESTGVDAFEWAVRAVELGAGEVLVTSIDQEGTGKGFDLELTKRIAQAVDVPVVACGGAGHFAHVSQVIQEASADAICVASMFHYGFVDLMRQHPADYTSEGNTEFLQSGSSFSKVQPLSVPELKSYLMKEGISCRPFTETLKVAS